MVSYKQCVLCFFIQTVIPSWKVSNSCLQGITDDVMNEALPLVSLESVTFGDGHLHS